MKNWFTSILDWTDFQFFQTLEIQTQVKPTVKNLNSTLLKFTQGSEIFEQNMEIPALDGKQASKILFHKKRIVSDWLVLCRSSSWSTKTSWVYWAICSKIPNSKTTCITKAKLSGSIQRIQLLSVFLEICTLGCGCSGRKLWWEVKRLQLGSYFIRTRLMPCKGCSATLSTVRNALMCACYSF